MSKVTIAIVAVCVIILAGGVFLLTRESGSSQVLNTANNASTVNSTTQYLYFWSKTCSHCANVAEFMESWEGKDSFEMKKYEINESADNRNLFIENGTKICNKPANRLGVPLLITPDGECFSGDTPIIKYLKQLTI